MKLKKTGMLIFLIIVLFSLVNSIQAKPIVSISDFEVEGGQLHTYDKNFYLDINLENSGETCAVATTVSIQANSPFITDESPTTEPVDICGHHETVSLPIRLEPNINGGSYPLTLIVSFTDENKTNTYSFSNTITLFIIGNSIINANIVNSNPLNVYPGDIASISVLVENDGTFQAQSIKGTLKSNSPLEIKSSNSFFSIGSLQPKQSYLADFAIEVPKDAKAQVYPMTLSIEYIENKIEKKKDIQLLFDVKKKATFKTSNAGSDTLYPNDFGKIIRIKVINTGTDAAKDIKVQLQPQYPFTTDGSIRYLTNLDQRDSGVVQFAIDVDKDATIGNYGVNVILDFQDEAGNNLHDSVVTSITIQKKSLLQVLFIDYWFIWIIVLIVIFIILMRLSRRKKSPKANMQETN